MVRCDEGKCILESLMCNDEDDCLDGTDEPSTCGELHAAAGHCPCVWGWRWSRRAVPCLLIPLQVGAASYATGAVRTPALTRTGECSAPVGMAGCCRRTGRAVLVRTGQSAHALGTPGLGHRVGVSLEPVFAWEHLPQPRFCLCATPGPAKAGSRPWPSNSCCVWGLWPRPWYLGSLPVAPGELCRCCLGAASQLRGGLLAVPVLTDVDECSLEYSPCSQLCSNTPGAFSCACLQGYTLWHGTACEVAGRVSWGAWAVLRSWTVPPI